MHLKYLQGEDKGQRFFFATVFLILARITVGSIFFTGGLTKPPPGFNWFPDWVMKESQYAQIGLYKAFLDHVVIPHMTFFGWLQFLTELTFGGLVLVGLFTRLSGFVLGLWSLNIAIGSYPVPGEAITNLELFVLMPFIVGALATGRTVGLDAWLRPKFVASSNALVRALGTWAM